MKKKIIIPESINDITLGQYQKYIELESKELDEYSKICRKLEIFTGLIRSEIEGIKQKDIDLINKQIDDAFEKQGEFKTKFTLNGIEFGLIPNFDKMQSKEYFDLSSYGVDIETLHRVMAILYRPIKENGKTYTINEYNGTEHYADFMKQMPLVYVNGALSFFLTLQNDLLNYFQKFTMEVQVRELERTAILKSGVGLLQSMN